MDYDRVRYYCFGCRRSFRVAEGADEVECPRCHSTDVLEESEYREGWAPGYVDGVSVDLYNGWNH